LSNNREELFVTDLSCVLYNYVDIPFYETLGPNTIEYILNQTEMEVMVISEDAVEKIAKLKVDGKTGNLKTVVVMKTVPSEQLQLLISAGLTALTFSDLIAKGRANP
jgi:long-chain acyl-CoA synthetase